MPPASASKAPATCVIAFENDANDTSAPLEATTLNPPRSTKPPSLAPKTEPANTIEPAVIPPRPGQSVLCELWVNMSRRRAGPEVSTRNQQPHPTVRSWTPSKIESRACRLRGVGDSNVLAARTGPPSLWAHELYGPRPITQE